ncbi:MAG: hypothetical protein JXR51_02315 [Bacteroidales bacterium]|nr:hypothetical protein [Bacteroidales bacterium]
MALSGIIILIVLGIILILLEFFVVPGITIAGIGGVLLLVAGVWVAYANYGITTGNYVLLSTIIALIIILIIAFNSKTWEKISLKAQINSKVKSDDNFSVKIGDKGKTISKMSPMGTVIINDKLYEAESKGIFIDENTEIEVIKIIRNKLIVKLDK